MDENHPFARDYMDCQKCIEEQPSYVRARWSCGWMAEKKRVAKAFPRIGAAPDSDECPGYLIQLPEVMEAARALSWRQDGVLGMYYDEPMTQVAIDAVDVIGSEVKVVERHSLRQAQQKVRHG